MWAGLAHPVFFVFRVALYVFGRITDFRVFLVKHGLEARATTRPRWPCYDGMLDVVLGMGHPQAALEAATRRLLGVLMRERPDPSLHSG